MIIIAKPAFKHRPRAGPVGGVWIAVHTDQFSGAEVEQAIIDGLFTAFEADRELQLDDVIEAAKDRTPLAKTAKEDIQRIREWGKSGRARPASRPDPTANITIGRGPKLQT